MNKFTSYSEKLKTIEKRKLAKYGVIIVAAIGFLSAIVLFAIAFIAEDFDVSARAMRIGGGIFSSLVGLWIVYGFVQVGISLIKGRQEEQNNSAENQITVKTYTYTNYSTDTSSKITICEFCGYKNKANNAECSKCSAPIK